MCHGIPGSWPEVNKLSVEGVHACNMIAIAGLIHPTIHVIADTVDW